MSNPTLNAEIRTLAGRKVKKLRNEGVLPANIYGKKIKSQAIQISLKDFESVYKEVGETGLLELVVGKEKKPVLVHNVQPDPVSGSYIHVDFVQVDLKQKINAQVPVELVGESPAVKQGLGTVVQYIDEIEVKALPSDFPDKFEIDISQLLEVDQTIQIKDIKVDKSKVEVQEAEDEIIVKVEAQKEEVEELPPATEGEVVEEDTSKDSLTDKSQSQPSQSDAETTDKSS